MTYKYVWVVVEEPDYEGGGSYSGLSEVVKVFWNRSNAEEFANTNPSYQVEESEFDDSP